MKIEKRDSPIEIKVSPYGAGWSDISWFVPKEMSEPLSLTASYTGRNMSDFARALYHLSPNQFETDIADDLMDSVSYKYDAETNRVGEICSTDEAGLRGTYIELPVKAVFHWDEEPGGSDWTLSREPPAKINGDIDFSVHVQIVLKRYRDTPMVRQYDFDFMYSDLCYAVGKALTEVMKKQGLYGYFYSTSDKIDIIHLIYIKAVALGCSDVLDLIYQDQRGGEISDFQKEMEILMFDM